jgi:hypothetical protein
MDESFLPPSDGWQTFTPSLWLIIFTDQNQASLNLRKSAPACGMRTIRLSHFSIHSSSSLSITYPSCLYPHSAISDISSKPFFFSFHTFLSCRLQRTPPPKVHQLNELIQEKESIYSRHEDSLSHNHYQHTSETPNLCRGPPRPLLLSPARQRSQPCPGLRGLVYALPNRRLVAEPPPLLAALGCRPTKPVPSRRRRNPKIVSCRRISHS